MPYSDATVNQTLKLLRSSLQRKTFTLAEASKALNRPNGTVRHLLWLLLRKGDLKRLGRGLYGFASATPPATRLADQGHRIREILTTEGIDFVISGLDILLPYIHSPVRRYPTLVYVAPGGADWAKGVLESHSITALVEPDKQALDLGLELTPEDRLIAILRHLGNRYAVEDHIATVERAIVDLYYEVTRDQFPLSTTELLRAVYYAVSSSSLRYSKLFHYASRREIRGELVKVLRELDRSSIPKTYLKERITSNRFTAKLPSLDEAVLR